MTSPRRFLVRMTAFLTAVAFVAGVLYPGLESMFMANAALNGLILGVCLVGITYNFRQVFMLKPEVAWIEHYRAGGDAHAGGMPNLLASMAAMLGEQRRDKLRLSAMGMRSLLDGIASRLDESRDISRYTVGLLIFLGLLGTFWGLQETVRSVGGVISGLGIGGNDVAQIFNEFKQGLAAPLRGMGTSFSASLFGLSGSLVLGFLDLQAGQAQNRFFNDLEEWLSSLTRLSSGPFSGGDNEGSVPTYLQALMEQMAETLENLQRSLHRGEENRIAAGTGMMALVERLGVLNDQMRAEGALMIKLAENQIEMRPILARLAESVAGNSLARSDAIDDATRNHIRNIDLHIGKMLEEMSIGRSQMTQELRSEIKLLARTVAALADEQ